MKLLRKKTVWVPTRQGWALFISAAALLFYGAIRLLYPFLAQTVPRSDASVIIVEGWISDDELAEVAAAVKPGQTVVTTGGPVFFGAGLIKEKTYAEVTAARLLLAGFPPERLLCAPASETPYDRTYASALAARDVLTEKGLQGQPCLIYTVGTHSRRSLYLYRRAFGPEWPAGIVSLESREYDLRRWWRSSHAFKQVLGELISWVYTLLSPWKYA